ncbi:hypothetical protein CTEN210_17841 [Chaetoceros tenuissimus]|uniref:DDE Tnp4 domain-containing protein n=2 Tax=Chaetoceros tenuissimus TaxID=426638 RepID=A0AAD3DDG7_9STRA|nr:hypothetical protein CTEN210_12063 [Chaetoceros tenuissimus]GFH61365.1 hypothetical protein CTEN210_17841 [Chaetoceros tenuissimus]
MPSIYREMGELYFRRAYRMSYTSFRLLFREIKQVLYEKLYKTEGREAPNGRIPLDSRLGIGVRYFAGGDPYDISISYGVSHSSVFDTVDAVVDAINSHDRFKIMFPTDHDEQRRIAAEFKTKSRVGFSNCCGAIDGMLVWIHKPSKKECEEAKVDERKWFCSRKNKYGLNLQAICDSRKRFLDLSILFGGSSSDLIAFESSPIRQKLEQPGFLADGLCLFGDNAYVNTKFMATPYVKSHRGWSDLHDNYNFYHSQLRINIECAFGILCQRWGFLRKPAPKKYSIKKIMAFVSCLCRLHNFLIDQNPMYGSSMLAPTPRDAYHLSCEGQVDVSERRDGYPLVPNDLSGGGEHFDDDTQRTRRSTVPRGLENMLPREQLMIQVSDSGFVRPSVT